MKNDEERKFILLQMIHSDVKGNQNFSLHNEKHANNEDFWSDYNSPTVRTYALIRYQF